MQVVAPKGWTRLGSGAQARGSALIGISGAGESGKTRLAAAAPRACPDWFGPRAVYLAIDPEAASLGSVLLEDRPNMEVVGLDGNKDLHAQIRDVYLYDWRKEGIQLIITDTMTVAAQEMLAQITNTGRFSEKQIELSAGVKQSMMGDFGGTHTLIMALLRQQKNSGMNHITLFHDIEVRPEAGQPGEPIGGPATVGKGQVRSIVNWYNTMLHVVRRPKKRTDLSRPMEYERVVYTTGHGIWQAKLREPGLTNPIPEIIAEGDPANVWRVLHSTINPSK